MRTSAIYRIKDDAALVKLALRYMDLDQRRKYLTPEGVKWYRREAGITIGRVRSQEMLDELAHHENRMIRQCALENENCGEELRKAYLAENSLKKRKGKKNPIAVAIRSPMMGISMLLNCITKILETECFPGHL